MTGLDIRTALIPRLGAVGLDWYFATLPHKVSITHDKDPWPTLKAILDRDPIPGTRLVRATVGGACLVEMWPPPPTCKESLQVAPEPATIRESRKVEPVQASLFEVPARSEYGPR